MSTGNVVPYSDPDHQPVVPPWAGVPWCSCGWRGRPYDAPILADHLAEVGSVPLSIHMTKEES